MYAQALAIQQDVANVQTRLADLLALNGFETVQPKIPHNKAQEESVQSSASDTQRQKIDAPGASITPWYNNSQGGAGGQSPLLPKVSEGESPPSPPPGDPPDTDPPSFSFSITKCDDSFSSVGCVVAPQTLNLSWSSTADDLKEYQVTCSVDGASCAGFITSPTTATSTTHLVADQKMYTFEGFAKDNAGNTSTTIAITVEVWAAPVVINEIAWRGTSASNAVDEWIELKNNTSKAISLSQFVLYSETDLGPYLSFADASTKTIPANGYYLIERTDDTTISTITGDFVTPFGNGFGNAIGETLSLVKVSGGATTTIDRVPVCGNQWCGGLNGSYYTMERRDFLIAGNIENNWGTHNGVITREKDADGAGVLATPKARNSLHYLIDAGAELSANKTLTKINSPYIITDTFTVPSGKTLTINKGVVIKFEKNTSALEVAGTLIANGASDDNIILTSFNDDTYGGDTDDKSITPSAGAWHHVKILSSATNTSLNYVRMRYGGYITSGQSDVGRALLRVESAPVTVTNSIFEYSAYYGIHLGNSNSIIATSTFSNMNPGVDIEGTHAALLASGGSPLISGNAFTSNKRGIYLSGSAQANIKANTFTNHTDYAITQSSGAAAFVSNSGSSNTGNAILLSSNLGITGATTTLVANTLPFVLSGAVTIPQNSAIAIEKGTVIKGTDSSSFIVSGNLLLNGATSSDIVFEADTDTAPDGYWTGITLETTSKATLKGFTLRSAGGPIPGFPGTKTGLRAKIPVTIENALIEKNRHVGIWLDEPSTIRNTIFRKHLSPSNGSAKALLFENTSVTLDTITFSNNTTGIYAGGSATATSTGPVIFENNTTNTTPADLL